MRTSDDITNVVNRFSDTVARACAVYFGARPERDDAFQETFLRYAQSTKEFEGDEHCKAWLIRVAANVCKDMLKSAESKAVLLDEFEDTASPAHQGIEASDRFDELNEALQQLDEKQRVPLYLKYYEGYTAAEIGEMLDMPENTVYTHLARGREKLKEVLTRG